MEQIKNSSRFNLFRFLSGGARRLPPLRSVFILLFSFVFVFGSCLVPSSAAMVQPQIQPISGATPVQVTDYVSSLTPDQLEIFYLLSGSQAISYTGFGNYEITEAPQSSSDSANWLKTIGQKFYTDLFFGSIGLPSSVAPDLYDALLGNAQYSAGVSSSFSQWVSQVQSSEEPFFIPLGVGLIPAFNQVFAQYGGFNQWQSSTLFYDPLMFSFSWLTYPLSGNVLVDYESVYFSMVSPKVRFSAVSSSSNHRNSVFSCSRFHGNSGYFDFNRFHNIFINTSSHLVYLCDDLGVQATNGRYSNWELNVSNNSYIGNQDQYVYIKSFSSSEYSNIGEVFSAINDNPQLLVSAINDGYFYPCLSDFVVGLYYGDSWLSRVEWSSDIDLGFAQPSPAPASVSSPVEEYLLDIKGLLEDLVGAQLAQQPVYDNLYDSDGQPVTDPATTPISVSVSWPDSGIIIPIGLFGSLTDDGGYIDYLWFMTKPLVQFTKSLVDSFTFDGFDGADPVSGETVHFSGSGPGMIVFGVVSVGLISGFVVKCLL